jgi:hypothetical protein
VKRTLAGFVAVAFLLGAGAALAARGYSDTSGDSNAAPDITSVEVAEGTAGVLAIRVSIGNFQALPTNSWVNLWFDVDSDTQTGDAGDEALVRYSSDGSLQLYAWDGSRLIESSTAGMTGSYAAGVLSLSLPRVSINAIGGFGLLAVSSRGQFEESDQFVASDYAPDVGRSAYDGTTPAVFPDALNDHDAAPDITGVRVSDAKSGWITFAVSTPNYARLPVESALVLLVDVDNNGRTGEDGADLGITSVAGEVALERWDTRSKNWVPDDLPTRARVRNSGNVVSVDVHTSELDNARRFGFSLLSLDLNTAIQEVQAADFAPDDLSFWRYTLANKPALKLVFTRIIAKPAKPKAGRTFTVGFVVTRSDTGRGVTAGTVGCRVLSAETKVPAKGRIAGGAGLCTFVVPKSAQGSVIRGTVTVRSGGKSLARDFAFLVL